MQKDPESLVDIQEEDEDKRDDQPPKHAITKLEPDPFSLVDMALCVSTAVILVSCIILFTDIYRLPEGKTLQNVKLVFAGLTVCLTLLLCLQTFIKFGKKFKLLQNAHNRYVQSVSELKLLRNVIGIIGVGMLLLLAYVIYVVAGLKYKE